MAGSPYFKNFYEDKDVCEKFLKCAIEGLQRAEADKGVDGPDVDDEEVGNNQKCGGMNEYAVNLHVICN